MVEKQQTGFRFGKYKLTVLEEYGKIEYLGRTYKIVKVKTNDNLQYISIRLYNRNQKFIKQFLIEPEIINSIAQLLLTIKENR